jgi:hypothetical protein
LTKLLRDSLEDDGFDADHFAVYFGAWKALGPAGEFSDPYFGKDAEYARPVRNGKRVLRHVHLPPESSPVEVSIWNANAARCSRKTSDTSLVYAFDHRHGYLLIYIVREPDGHSLATMATKESADLMNSFADAAEAFLHDGSIVD